MRLKRLILASSAAFLASAMPALANKPTDGGIWLQEPASVLMDDLTWLHNFVSWIILGIVIFVMVLMAYIMIRFREKANPEPSKTTHHVGLEVAWTIAPIIILLIMVVPSMRLLYFQDVIPETDITIKVTGNTWNWEYAYPDQPDFDSYISNPLSKEEAAFVETYLSEKSVAEASEFGEPYLLATDAPLVLPVDTKVKILVTSSNNLHAFTIPALGFKIDAVPGRINETWFEAYRTGTFYGQCSELCGINHYYMPIELRIVSKAEYAKWVAQGGGSHKEAALAAYAASKKNKNAALGGGLATAAQK